MRTARTNIYTNIHFQVIARDFYHSGCWVIAISYRTTESFQPAYYVNPRKAHFVFYKGTLEGSGSLFFKALSIPFSYWDSNPSFGFIESDNHYTIGAWFLHGESNPDLSLERAAFTVRLCGNARCGVRTHAFHNTRS